VPATQVVQLADPVAAALPAAQLVQRVALLEAEYVPEAQLEQTPLPSVENFPGVH